MLPEGSTRLMVQIVATAFIVVWPVVAGFVSAFVNVNAGLAMLGWWLISGFVVIAGTAFLAILSAIWMGDW